MNEIKVSSITYVKNGENYIEQCIRSIMSQTLKDIEIIVVDGGSTDGTINIINKLCLEDRRIKFIVEEGSVGAQFNKALKMATGEYVAICEGDDYVLSDKYRIQYGIAKANNLDMLRACYYQFFEYGDTEYRYKVETAPSKDLYDRLIIVEDDILLALGVNGFWNGLYNRDFLIGNDIYMNETKGAAYQDISFSFLCQSKAKRVWFMKDAYHCYRIDNYGASVNSNNCIELHTEEYRLLRKRLLNNGMWDKYQNNFIVWELGSYKHFIDVLMGVNKKTEAEKIYNILIKQNIVDNYSRIRMPKNTGNLVKALHTDKELFIQLLINNEDKNNKLLKYFSDSCITEKKIILFGIGHLGSIIYDFLKLIGKEVYIVDNSKELQRTGFRGEKVNCPDDFIIDNQYTIIVANVLYANDICNQLRALGVVEKRIIVCDNENLFLRKIFVGMGCKYGLKQG